MNQQEFVENMNNHTLEELAPYEGQQVAWSEDGKTVLAHGVTDEELYAEIDRIGITRYVICYVPRADDIYPGGPGY
jgi:hypothetical protein